MVVRNVILAFLLSMTLTFGLGLVYVFYPLISAIVQGMLRNSGNGIVAAAGGVSGGFFIALLVLEPLLFLLIFVLLQTKSAQH